GRFFPPSEVLLRGVPFFRYPEKWWVLVTFSLAAAAAVGVERLTAADESVREATWRILKTAALILSAPLLVASLLSVTSPELLRKGIWMLGLGAGDSQASRVARALFFPLSAGFLSLVTLSLVCSLVIRRRTSARTAFAFMSFIFFADA